MPSVGPDPARSPNRLVRAGRGALGDGRPLRDSLHRAGPEVRDLGRFRKSGQPKPLALGWAAHGHGFAFGLTFPCESVPRLHSVPSCTPVTSVNFTFPEGGTITSFATQVLYWP